MLLSHGVARRRSGPSGLSTRAADTGSLDILPHSNLFLPRSAPLCFQRHCFAMAHRATGPSARTAADALACANGAVRP